MKTHVIATLVALFSFCGFAQAELSWTGAVSTDIFDIGNWDTSSSTVAGPLAPNMNIDDDVIVSGAFANNPTIPDVSAQQRFQLGDGYSLTLDGATWDIVAGSNDGVGADPAGTLPSAINAMNGSAFNTFFIVNRIELSIDSTSQATFGGGGNPVNLSTIDMQPGAELYFVLENPTEFTNEHLSKVTVNGQPAVDGLNISIADWSNEGSLVTAMVPEPSAIGLLLMATLGLMGFCRR